MLIRFLSLPVTLGLLTAAYNFARFHSIFDFGYIHIPEVARRTLVSARAYFRFRLFPGISIPCYSKALRVLITFLTFGQTVLAARSFLPARSYVFCFAKADDIR